MARGAEAYTLPPMSLRESAWADFGDPPVAPDAAEPEDIAVAADQLFEQWRHATRKTCSLLEVQLTLLADGGRLRLLWPRRLLARAGCWCRSRGRPGRMNRDDFVTLLTRLLPVVPAANLDSLLTRMSSTGMQVRELEEANIRQCGDDDQWLRVLALLCGMFRKWDRVNDGVVVLQVLRGAIVEYADACQRRGGEDAAKQRCADWKQRAGTWAHPMDGAREDEDDACETCCGERMPYTNKHWSGVLSYSMAKDMMLWCIPDLLPDTGTPEEWTRFEAAAKEIDAQYFRLLREHVRRRTASGDKKRRPDSAPSGGRFLRRARESIDVETRLTHLQCQHCSRCMLRVNADGSMPALRDGDDGIGEVRPLHCAGCLTAHLDWTPVTTATAVGRLLKTKAFDDYSGVNVEEREKTRRKHVVFVRDGEDERPQRRIRSPLSLQKARRRSSLVKDVPVMNECQKCGRRMLSMLGDGTPLSMMTGVGGGPIALRCPGCDAEHADWRPAAAFDPSGTHCSMRSEPLPAKTQARLRGIFDNLDAQETGLLRRRELVQLWLRLSTKMPRSEAERLTSAAFDMTDKRRTGRISFNQIVSFVQSTFTLADAPWLRMSTDPGNAELRPGSGKLAAEEERKNEERRRIMEAAHRADAERERRRAAERAMVMRRCRVCGRHTLNVSGDGQPYRPGSGAFGGSAPELACGQCGSSDWEERSAFCAGRGQVEMQRLQQLSGGRPPPWSEMDPSPAVRPVALTPVPPPPRPMDV